MILVVCWFARIMACISILWPILVQKNREKRTQTRFRNFEPRRVEKRGVFFVMAWLPNWYYVPMHFNLPEEKCKIVKQLKMKKLVTETRLARKAVARNSKVSTLWLLDQKRMSISSLTFQEPSIRAIFSTAPGSIKRRNFSSIYARFTAHGVYSYTLAWFSLFRIYVYCPRRPLAPILDDLAIRPTTRRNSGSKSGNRARPGFRRQIEWSNELISVNPARPSLDISRNLLDRKHGPFWSDAVGRCVDMHMLSVIDLDSDRKIEIKLGKVFTASALYTSSCFAAENQVKVYDRSNQYQQTINQTTQKTRILPRHQKHPPSSTNINNKKFYNPHTNITSNNPL